MLSRAAVAIPAQLYIAHNLAALPAAYAAAKKRRCSFGFDAEDFHTEELTDSQRDKGDQRAREIIENNLLPRCSYRTAASPLIAEIYHRKYGVTMQPILNVFPLCQAPQHEPDTALPMPRSMYWFSQTVGSGRGVEEVLQAMGSMINPPFLYIRGNVSPSYKAQIFEVSERLGIAAKVQVLPPAAPDQMARLSAGYSLGLAVEPGSSPNNKIALSNKIFTYLLAGIPVLLSRTPAQEALAEDLGDAGILIDLADPKQLGATLSDFLADEPRQHRARAAAWRIAHERYNWDIEKHKFLALVERTLLSYGT
ncbi:MAG: hypothetical protein H0U43_08750 [Chthoniobacterales bacterium]|nr:hypothetical protein [Chthoniobacterales bacterium]